jgi:ubiquitin-protein ligase E3 B
VSNNELKNAVKVAFISSLGYEEAGIDQRGVFKEFLEETCKKAFANELNFFQRNGDGRVCISPSSHIQENHLQYFYYFGRVLGKALYEGTILDIPFALFIYSKFLGRYNYLVRLSSSAKNST